MEVVTNIDDKIVNDRKEYMKKYLKEYYKNKPEKRSNVYFKKYIKEGKHKCESCDKSFPSKSHLAIHLKTMRHEYILLLTASIRKKIDSEKTT